MGQTNVLARYPMHFHLIGDCPECYFKHSAIHRSYYRCATIHGTNSTLVTENVAYNIIGYCYYLEDGVEMENTISHNLGAHIHYLGEKPAWVDNGQSPEPFVTSEHLALPADATASPFYITNVHNTIVGNAASGVSLTSLLTRYLRFGFAANVVPFFWQCKGLVWLPFREFKDTTGNLP